MRKLWARIGYRFFTLDVHVDKQKYKSIQSYTEENDQQVRQQYPKNSTELPALTVQWPDFFV